MTGEAWNIVGMEVFRVARGQTPDAVLRIDALPDGEGINIAQERIVLFTGRTVQKRAVQRQGGCRSAHSIVVNPRTSEPDNSKMRASSVAMVSLWQLPPREQGRFSRYRMISSA